MVKEKIIGNCDKKYQTCSTSCTALRETLRCGSFRLSVSYSLNDTGQLYNVSFGLFYHFSAGAKYKLGELSMTLNLHPHSVTVWTVTDTHSEVHNIHKYEHK